MEARRSCGASDCYSTLIIGDECFSPFVGRAAPCFARREVEFQRHGWSYDSAKKRGFRLIGFGLWGCVSSVF